MPSVTDEFAKRLESQLGQRTGPQNGRAAPGAKAPGNGSAGRTGAGALHARVNPAFCRPAGMGPSSMERPNGAADDEFSGRLTDQLASASFKENEPEAAESSDEAPADIGPVGTGGYEVRQGDCISSIASAHGHFWETLWNDAANEELRQVRADPNTLLPGDRVTVPPIRKKSEPGMAEMRHRFRKKGQPETLRLRILEDDEPRANEPYVLDVDGEVTEGTTDANGQVTRPIKPNARRAKLAVGEGEKAKEYVFVLGGLDPLTETSGLQGRLNSLGFDCGQQDGKWGPRTKRAIEEFQAHHALPVTGQPDDATRQKLREAYGC